ncbi:MAG: hypothetical protein ACRC3Y_00455 [Romboutsia sp.]|uniref:hypothetical protein n=1 Tax=Romboutsia sp. TaxID=1965302 RepID=UPI003F314E61
MNLRTYTFKKHVFFSICVSFVIGVISFLIFRPDSINSSKGTIQSIDATGIVHTQMSYGYDFIGILVLISLIILLIMFKPIKKIGNRELEIKGDK